MILEPEKSFFLPLSSDASGCQGQLLITGPQPLGPPKLLEIKEIVAKTLQTNPPLLLRGPSTPPSASVATRHTEIKKIATGALEKAGTQFSKEKSACDLLLKATVRHAISKDMNAVRQFTNALLKTTYSAAFFFQYLYSPDCFCLIMTLPTGNASDINIIGVITGKLDWSGKTGLETGMNLADGHVHTLAVDPEYRRHGVASQLLSEFEVKLSCHAVHKSCILGSLSLEVQTKNKSAIAFYDRNSFHPSSDIKKGYYGGLEDAQQMRKILV